MRRSASAKNIRSFGSIAARHGAHAEDSGVHICLRAPDAAAVDAFHAAALAGGGSSDGTPGLRPKYHLSYYAAFIRDPDGNRIEAVTFLREGKA